MATTTSVHDLENRSALLAALVWAMMASSFQIFALAVLTVDLLAEFSMSRAEIGVVGAVNTMIGALTAPASGRLTDRIGARTSIIVTLVLSGLGMGLMAASTSVVMLAASAVVAGIPQGWGNPATNALIAERVAVGRRGTITGIKQSGVQAGIFLSGFTLPTLALWFGWRGASWVYAVAFAAAAVVVTVALPPRAREMLDGAAPVAGVDRAGAEPPTSTTVTAGGVRSGMDGTRGKGPDGPAMANSRPASNSDRLHPWIRRLAVYALLMGTVGGATSRFFPLWAHETVGFSVTVAGLLVAITGLLGIGARIIVGRLAETRIAPPPLLAILALVGAGYCLSLLATPWIGAWLPWPSTVLSAIGIAAWNAVAMLAIIVTVPRRQAGRASGVVMFGFLGGLSIGSPAAGWIVDATGSYQPVWTACLILAVISAVVLVDPRRPSAGRSEPVTAPD